MNEFIEKLIGRLEELGWVFADYYPDETVIHRKRKKSVAYDDVIEIVNQLAEEYKQCNRLSCNDCEVYDKEKHYCPKWCDVIKHTAEELAEEYNGGWINADVASPTENGKYIVYYRKWTDGNYLPKFYETEIRIFRYRNNDWVFPTYGDTEAEKDIHREVLAWQPLPAPYQPKGE